MWVGSWGVGLSSPEQRCADLWDRVDMICPRHRVLIIKIKK